MRATLLCFEPFLAGLECQFCGLNNHRLSTPHWSPRGAQLAWDPGGNATRKGIAPGPAPGQRLYGGDGGPSLWWTVLPAAKSSSQHFSHGLAGCNSHPKKQHLFSSLEKGMATHSSVLAWRIP